MCDKPSPRIQCKTTVTNIKMENCVERDGASQAITVLSPTGTPRKQTSSFISLKNAQKQRSSIINAMLSLNKKSDSQESSTSSEETQEMEEGNSILKLPMEPLRRTSSIAPKKILLTVKPEHMVSPSKLCKEVEQISTIYERTPWMKASRNMTLQQQIQHIRATCDFIEECAICTLIKCHRENSSVLDLSLGTMVSLALANQDGLCMKHNLPLTFAACTENPPTTSGGMDTMDKSASSSTTSTTPPVCLLELGNGFWTDTQSRLKSRVASLLGELHRYSSRQTTHQTSGSKESLRALWMHKRYAVESTTLYVFKRSGRRQIRAPTPTRPPLLRYPLAPQKSPRDWGIKRQHMTASEMQAHGHKY